MHAGSCPTPTSNAKMASRMNLSEALVMSELETEPETDLYNTESESDEGDSDNSEECSGE